MGRLLCCTDHKKQTPHCTWLTIGGNKPDYPWDAGTTTVNITTSKLLSNSTISTPGVMFIMADIKNFYLSMPLDHYVYMHLPLSIIPTQLLEQYKLHELATDGWVKTEVQKGMYGLKQAGKLANTLLTKCLIPHWYYPCQYTPGLSKHTWLPITFVIVVDDFSLKFTRTVHATHLYKHYSIGTRSQLNEVASISMVWPSTGTITCTCDISMPTYIHKALTKCQHPLWPVHNTLPTNTYQLNMDKLHKKPSLTLLIPIPHRTSNISRMLWAHFSTMFMLLTPH